MSNHKLTLRASFVNGEGSIGNVEEWRATGYPLLRADILQDWVRLLEEEYWVAREDMTKEFEEGAKAKTMWEYIE